MEGGVGRRTFLPGHPGPWQDLEVLIILPGLVVWDETLPQPLRARPTGKTSTHRS